MDREIKLCPQPESVRKARRFVRENLTELGYPTLIDDGTLIVSELVTNSLTAALSTPLWVAMRRTDPYVVIEVWDCSPEKPVVRSPEDMDEGGRGLNIVSKLTQGHYGSKTFTWGKVVWVLLS
jgi:anti-sigma regulatory factor (Ser/Thr protein kinase)